jgi:ABC-type multidrug transport system ATPase subunit
MPPTRALLLYRVCMLIDRQVESVIALVGGMKRKLSMAICCVSNPKILFMDEPTTGLDPNSCRQIWCVETLFLFSDACLDAGRF